MQRNLSKMKKMARKRLRDLKKVIRKRKKPKQTQLPYSPEKEWNKCKNYSSRDSE